MGITESQYDIVYNNVRFHLLLSQLFLSYQGRAMSVYSRTNFHSSLLSCRMHFISVSSIRQLFSIVFSSLLKISREITQMLRDLSCQWNKLTESRQNWQRPAPKFSDNESWLNAPLPAECLYEVRNCS